MRIHRLRITNYRGIEALDTPVGEHGLIARGKCDSGKTSLLNSVRAAFAAQDISPAAIRQGADRAEILVNLDDVTVRRVITAKGSTLTVENAEGFERKKPQTWLTEMLGTAAIDPLELYDADAKKRKQIILDALPIRMTEEQLAKWVPSYKTAQAFVGMKIESMHGLDVIAEFHKEFYAQRALANAQLKAAIADVDRERKALEAMPPAPSVALTVDVAEKQSRAAHSDLCDLEDRKERAAVQAEKTKATRERIADLRSKPEAATNNPTDDDLADAEQAIVEARNELQRAEKALAVLKQARVEATVHNERLDARNREAAALEKMLNDVAEVAPTDEEIERARAKFKHAERLFLDSEQTAEVNAQKAKVETLQRIATDRESEANGLSVIVETLAKVAPAELVASSKGIPGLGIAVDDITLDGVSIDALSGNKKLRFAVEIAKRANAQSKMLVVDGLERLDAEQLEDFVRVATSGGFQLLATRVDSGERVLEAIEFDEAEAAE